MHARLVRTNWWRTAAWTLGGAVALAMLGRWRRETPALGGAAPRHRTARRPGLARGPPGRARGGPAGRDHGAGTEPGVAGARGARGRGASSSATRRAGATRWAGVSTRFAVRTTEARLVGAARATPSIALAARTGENASPLPPARDPRGDGAHRRARRAARGCASTSTTSRPRPPRPAGCCSASATPATRGPPAPTPGCWRACARAGHAVVDGEFDPALAGAAAPVRGPHGGIVAALTVVGARRRACAPASPPTPPRPPPPRPTSRRPLGSHVSDIRGYSPEDRSRSGAGTRRPRPTTARAPPRTQTPVHPAAG